LAESARPGVTATAGVITSLYIERFVPPAELRSLLDPLAGRAVEAMITRHHRGAGVGGLLVEGALREEADRLLASQIVRSVAVAVDNFRLYEVERSMALTLQRALLPDRSPTVAGLRIAARYAASDEHSEVGGDFYDAFAIDEQRVALAIGDVQGHSLEAASVMGELRAALRAYAIEGLGPAAVVERTNRHFRRFFPAQIATLCYAVVEPATRRATVVNAGHLPPLVAGPDGTWGLAGGATLLGVQGRPPSATVFELPADASLIFVTDGLVERRRRSLDDGLATMVSAVRDAWTTDVEMLSQVLLDRCRPHPSEDLDDIALMVVGFADPSPAAGRGPVVLAGHQMTVRATS
jgi:serine phosphatase RsbU (regulator of sigma subunit)